jgi:hypothetical protein
MIRIRQQTDPERGQSHQHQKRPAGRTNHQFHSGLRRNETSGLGGSLLAICTKRSRDQFRIRVIV